MEELTKERDDIKQWSDGLEKDKEALSAQLQAETAKSREVQSSERSRREQVEAECEKLKEELAAENTLRKTIEEE